MSRNGREELTRVSSEDGDLALLGCLICVVVALAFICGVVFLAWDLF